MIGKTATSVTSRKIRLRKILGEVCRLDNGKPTGHVKLNRTTSPHKFTSPHELLPGKNIQAGRRRLLGSFALPSPRSLTCYPQPAPKLRSSPQRRRFLRFSPRRVRFRRFWSRMTVGVVAFLAATAAMTVIAAAVAAPPAGPRAAKQREAFERFLAQRGVEPAPEKLAAFFRDRQPDGSRFSALRAEFQRFGEPEFAVREAALRSLAAEPWIPPQLIREFSQAPEPEVRWRTRRVQQLAGAAQEHCARVAARLLDAAALADVPRSLAPVPPPSPYARQSLGDHTLIATGTRGVAVELDNAGQELWRVPFRAWSAERLAGGATLLASVEEQAVVEVDQNGQVLWRHGPVAATRAKPLANGHLLIVDYPKGRVLELARDQSIRWQHTVDEPCFDAERLDNGHTLVATSNVIQEIAFDGAIVWQWQVRGRLNGMQALNDGRILVANYGANEVAELDDEGRSTRRIEEPQPSDAFRLPNGHTLVATATRVVEFNAAGELHRVLTTARYGSARR